MQMITRLKKDLFKSFNMKDLGTRQILSMQIFRDKKSKKLWLSQKKNAKRVLKRFNMKNAKVISNPLADHFKLNKQICLSTEKEKEEMARVHYSSVVGSLMYGMNIA